jgi:surface protein
LISLNLLNFDTSLVESMSDMFSGCSSLTSLNLSNFIISNIIFIGNMFSDCVNLEYINIISFNKSNSENFDYYDMFINTPENIVVCINKDNIQKIYPQIENKTCLIEDCTDD